MCRSRITSTYLLSYLSMSLTLPGNKVASVLDVVFGNINKVCWGMFSAASYSGSLRFKY